MYIYYFYSFCYFCLHLIFFTFFFFLVYSKSFVISFSIFSTGGVDITYSVILDYYSIGFLSFVFLISSVVMFYSTYYMGTDLSFVRFLFLVNLFVFSMMLLILSPSVLSMMLGWDGLGVISFLLVIYYQNMSSLKSGLLTIYTNRLGDVLIIFSIYLFFSSGFWYENYFLCSMEPLTLNIFLLLMAAMTKSAQIPFSAWLPAAMAAPTPVSSLVHSSTLVTAGVYLSIRFYYALSFFKSYFIFSILFITTAFMAGLVACLESDFKKVVAMSTLSQLGLMMFILSLGEVKYSYFHMVCHAIFKALLFMSCGLMIMMNMGGQDSRFMGSFSLVTPMLSLLMILSNMSLFGFPFFTGFYSKDMIIESSVFMSNSLMVGFILLVCCILTVIYSLRLSMLGMFSLRNGFGFYSFNLNNLNLFMMGLLGIWAISLGKLMSNCIFDYNLTILCLVESMVGFMIILSGFVFFYLNITKFLLVYSFVFNSFGEMLYLTWIFGGFFSSFSKSFNTSNKFDLLWTELLGPYGFFYFLNAFSSNFVFSKKLVLKLMFLIVFVLIFILLFSLYSV
uniref:NADH dehydrogenase subunit 5 n=1 Tax=Halotydeus destructor TaxID=2874060 RepID=UPI002028D4AB|nr:NADH dehydrogenase subunit 5 [Halotydeus destructor]UPN63258.1 NADH dehydrogenase subunit 5 [Halotydeus destructor]